MMLAILAMGAFHYSVHSVFIAAAMDVAGGQVQSTVVSLIYGSGVLGALSPVLAGAIADSYGVPNALLFGGSAVILSGAVVAMLKLPTTATQQARKAALPGR